ncbi:MFS transporter [Bacillus sp. B-jedd]|uniref:MFS transporter n=1 Tax=Bacillus sp. B-jedd TaxID=1476857 RepID=UPI00051570F8|nr:MFS transporter [Bacillus sp. B-jedd]CEG27013.1 transporter,membrane protein [Bacillus sp. B-jedd]
MEHKKFIPFWWKIVAVFTLGWVLMYADRTILNPVMPHLAEEFGLTNAQLGLVNSVFFIAYAIAQIPSGTMGDRYGRRTILVPGFILFGLLTGTTGLATSFFMFLLLRFVTGLGEGTYYGPSYAVATDNIPEKHLTVGTAIINSGMALGISLGYMLSSYFTLELGMSWRVPFYLMTIPTLLAAGLIWFMLRPNPQLKDITKEPGHEKVNIWEQLKNRNVMIILIMNFCSLYGFFMIITWLPQYLQLERGFHGSEVGYISSLIPWASIPAAILFGMFSDRLGRKKPIIFLLVPIAIVSVCAVAFIDNKTMLVIALLIYGFTGKLALDPVLLSFMARNVSKRAYATMFSIYNFAGMLSSIIAPYITGYLVDITGEMKTGFILAIIMMAIGLLAMAFTKEMPKEAQV